MLEGERERVKLARDRRRVGQPAASLGRLDDADERLAGRRHVRRVVDAAIEDEDPRRAHRGRPAQVGGEPGDGALERVGSAEGIEATGRRRR